MKIFEIIKESADSINTHLLLLGFDILKLEQISKDCISQFNTDRSLELALRNTLFTINQQCLTIHSNQEFWDGHSADPEVGLIYDRIAQLFNSNTDFLENGIV
jgi:hypothetical protein